MELNRNPFEYEEANKLSYEQILDVYIEDYNYSRFVRSTRNVFLIGERGTGKTMMLLYNSLPVVVKKAEREGRKPSLEVVNVYVPCATPLIHRREHELLEPNLAAAMSEHFLVVQMMYHTVVALEALGDALDAGAVQLALEEVAYVLDLELAAGRTGLVALKIALSRESSRAQRSLNSVGDRVTYGVALGFSTSVFPLLTALQRVPGLGASHFVFMLDDAQALNEHQVRALNSWIAYRDNSLFSFKVATAKIDRPGHETASGGAILEGHDYTVVDLEQPYQNQFSAFGRLARDIVERRLRQVGLNCTAEEFFPCNSEFEKEMEKYKEKARCDAIAKYGNGATPRQVSDYVYKYARAYYFKERASQANNQAYAGFDMLVHLSTGVIRNLLEPCWWMYDCVMSRTGTVVSGESVREIPPAVQSEVILERSVKKWEWVRDRLHVTIPGCSETDARQVFQLLDQLAVLFRKRLEQHESEPRGIIFSVSGRTKNTLERLGRILKNARKAQVLYAYTGSGKTISERVQYYVPNRILWPCRGLDPHGQHAAVQIPAEALLKAAESNAAIPTSLDRKDNSEKGGLV